MINIIAAATGIILGAHFVLYFIICLSDPESLYKYLIDPEKHKRLLWYSLTYNERIFLRIAMFIASPLITPYLLFKAVRHFIRGGLSFRQKVKERHFHELNEKLNTPPKEEIEDDEFSKMIRESMLISRRKCENWEDR